MPSPTRRRFLAALGATALASSAGCVTADAPTYDGAWTRRGYDDARTGASPASGPTGDLYAAWTADVFEGYPTSSPVVADGTVYHLHTRGGYETRHESVVSAFDAATGAETWRTEVAAVEYDALGYHHDSVVVDGAEDRVYARTFEGLHALSTDGEPLWTHPVPTPAQPYPLAAPPVVADGVVVTATYGERTSPVGVVGVDAATGEPRWRAGFASRRMPWTLSASEGVVYVPFFEGDPGLVALDPRTGATRWSASMPVDGPVTVAGDTLFVPVADDPGAIAAVDARTGDFVWRESASRRVHAGVAVADGLVYYCADGVLTVRDVASGTHVWSFGPRPAVSLSWTPVLAGSTVYAVARRVDGERSPSNLYALDAATGDVRGRGPMPVGLARPSLAVVDGAAYLAHRDELRCYESCALSVAGRCLVG